MDVFKLRDDVIDNYADYVRSFVRIREQRLRCFVEESLAKEALWPQPLIQMNPGFETGGWIDDLVSKGVLHEQCKDVFRIKTEQNTHGVPMRLHRHQVDAIDAARSRKNYVLTTGTGSGKSLSYIIPVVDHVLRNGRGKGIQAIVVYPMNALCNSQYGELEKFLRLGFADGQQPVTFDRYTGQDDQAERDRIAANPPDILLTNYVMLELILTRALSTDRRLVAAAEDLKFLVLDELHTYRGRQGADVALLVRRTREACRANDLLCVGTSATMASDGAYEKRRQTIADVATRLFGSVVTAANVIGETLQRATPELAFNNVEDRQRLTREIADDYVIPQDYHGFAATRMAAWLENMFGPRWDHESGRLQRADPMPLTGTGGAAGRLHELTTVDREVCAAAVRRWLLAGYHCEPNPDGGARPFAFRLHQFISRGDSVYCSLEQPEERVRTLKGQVFAAGQAAKRLYPMAFCRECGADYYIVRRVVNSRSGEIAYLPREMDDRERADTDRPRDLSDDEPGYLYRDPSSPWPADPDDAVHRVPDDWLEEHQGRQRIRRGMWHHVPIAESIGTDGRVDLDGLTFAFSTAPFRFCPCCGVSYRTRRGSTDFSRLSTLASGGRSTATTILSLYAVRFLRDQQTLVEHARKLLSFTDNRQDASLQAGHFNDFIEVSLLRAAIYRASLNAGTDGISHDELAQRIQQALSLPTELYAREPDVAFAAKRRTEEAFRNLLAYRVYRDLRRGWRVSSPNLEQCGLLKIEYVSLDELCADNEYWQNCHAALATASPETRLRLSATLLDYMRRELAIDVDYLRRDFFERLQQQSGQYLKSPWIVDEDERHDEPTVVFPRGRRGQESAHFRFLSGRSGFGQFLGRPNTLPDHVALNTNEKEHVCRDLMSVLARQMYLVETQPPANDDPHDVPGYQLSAACMQWHADDGSQALPDPIRVPNPPEEGGRTNPFFVDFYRNVAGKCDGLEAREHTAQVPYEQREQREKRFTAATLPILFCSPTMELGVDIAQLNVVNMRNVPPTPANYAQRSGRAGRSGQPAFVFTYCTTGSSHDQYFFRRPHRMVAGAVAPPRLDLANEDLIRAHVQAIWLAETQQSLGNALTEVLNVEGEQPTLDLLPSVRDGLTAPGVQDAAFKKAEAVLSTLRSDLENAKWYDSDWLRRTLNSVIREFETACDRWRDLFRAARRQQQFQHSVISDQARRHLHEEAKRLRDEAERQIRLLTETRNVAQSDFYTYRYLASEGFLPGYNFPRLPLSAYIPARRRMKGQDEFLSRPRFLAISEFGPRSIIYHEGSRYVVHKVILPVGAADGTTGSDVANAVTDRIKQCEACGYVHELRSDEAGPDRCENCDSPRLARVDSMLRLQNVATRRRDSITSDEEERLRLGYEIRTGLRFQEQSGARRVTTAAIVCPEGDTFVMSYGDAATIWRVNLGWRRRANQDQHGFVIDLERGHWERNDNLADPDDVQDTMGSRQRRVVPYVVDRRNCLLLEPDVVLDRTQFTSLMAALKLAIQAVFQLEDNELAAELLPSDGDARQILFFESAEGGAGVLRRLLDSSTAVRAVAREALEVCHFNADNGDEVQSEHEVDERCEAACYDCLMNYGNQRDHELLDRRGIRDLLLSLTECSITSAATALTTGEHLAQLQRQCDSGLERSWLTFLVDHGLRLPTTAQKFFEEAEARPDFFYEKQHVAVYIDGPPHDYAERQARDQKQTNALEDAGINVLRFHHTDNWLEIVQQWPNVFGDVRATATITSSPPATDDDSPDFDLFPADWHDEVRRFAEEGYKVEPGADVTDASGRVIGRYIVEAVRDSETVFCLENASEAVVAALEVRGRVVIRE